MIMQTCANLDFCVQLAMSIDKNLARCFGICCTKVKNAWPMKDHPH
jgi:hypothetical protein